jgi:hypothetical protein
MISIAPSSETMRVIAMTGPSETMLKAQLLKDPLHPRCQFADSCSHLEPDFCRLMQPLLLQEHAATSERA